MILILSGTKDGREIAYILYKKNYPLIVTTATDYGKYLIKKYGDLEVYSKKLNYEEMLELIDERNIKLVIDATHPYAEKVSKNINRACKYKGIPCFRFQRKEIRNLSEFQNKIQRAEDYEEAAKSLANREGNILLTIGSKTLDIFVKYINVQRLFARVLPTSDVLKRCEDLGFKPSNIIAMQGPFSKEMNIEIIKKYNIDIMVTKDSGKIGGTVEKLKAAEECGISVVVIERPNIYGELVYDDINQLIKKVCEVYG
ncbi:cobalt-precorrin-6A reductase [Caloranaerobacter azorensis]|uniref:Cobalt-precorrin-6A reductase n=1 Tax=Caloranaerobacter azorensis TaxID=116090 RepID=A0A6P1YBG3_9FIRM|nr:cobalt-precorrin-6A reductase [Caloranaerobacter azorensis]QIB26434.1 cobalt-precorrin-6A reductase [Caloranaerobacter azorensis]